MTCLARSMAAAALLAVVAGAWGQTQQVIVTGSVAEQKVEDAPYAITVVDREALRGAGPMINLSEALMRVPGLVVNNRSNYAQDLQISSRGFGARAGFGVRGMRLYTDGIPASGPDGQGQVSHFDLAGAERVEVLRGPFSVLFGNSSGGVIALFSAPVRRDEYEADVDVGSFGLRQARLGLAMRAGAGFEQRVQVSQMEVDGFRPHSAARKRQANLRLGWQGSRDRVVVLLNDLDQPTDDPLGLTRADFSLGPDRTAPQAIEFDTRKATHQTQLGAHWTHRFDRGALREAQLMAYSGRRDISQYLSIPVAAQANPRHGGGVVDFDRIYGGVDARLRFDFDSLGLVLGVAQEAQRDQRRGYENFTGSGDDAVPGVIGALRRDETDRARSRDVYVQAELPLGPVTASAGVRHGRIELSAADHYLANGDDSDRLDFGYTNPVLGLRWMLSPGLNLHASVGRGFESPTLSELAYRADGTGGFNAALKPQISTQAELGLKWRQGAWSVDAALFEARTRDEIGVATNNGGRSSFQNVGRTRRRGLELGAGWSPPGSLAAQLAFSVLDATYSDDFLTCAETPCREPSAVVPGGNRIAGAPRQTFYGEVSWTSGHWGTFALEGRGLGRVAVDDRNTDFAAGWVVGALRWTHTLQTGGGTRLEWLARVDNLTGHDYAGSVIVNAGNGRFFEPGAPRSVLLGLRWIGAL